MLRIDQQSNDRDKLKSPILLGGKSMKLKKRLLTAWIIPHIVLFFLNIWLLLFISVHEDGLGEINRLGMLTLIWIVFSIVWIFGLFKIIRWYKTGRFHE